MQLNWKMFMYFFSFMYVVADIPPSSSLPLNWALLTPDRCVPRRKMVFMCLVSCLRLVWVIDRLGDGMGWFAECFDIDICRCYSNRKQNNNRKIKIINKETAKKYDENIKLAENVICREIFAAKSSIAVLLWNFSRSKVIHSLRTVFDRNGIFFEIQFEYQQTLQNSPLSELGYGR